MYQGRSGNRSVLSVHPRFPATPAKISLPQHFSNYVCYVEAAFCRDLRLIKCKFGAIRVNYHSANVGKGVSMSPIYKSQIDSSRYLVFCPANCDGVPVASGNPSEIEITRLRCLRIPTR